MDVAALTLPVAGPPRLSPFHHQPPLILRRRHQQRNNLNHRHILSHQNRAATIAAVVGGSTAITGDDSGLVLEVSEIKEKSQKWQWKGQYSVNYFVRGPADGAPVGAGRPPLLLVHGFGASIPHWRRNIKILAQHYTVYAIDLLGFGSSDKPEGFMYTMETWAELILDFLNDVVQEPAVLIGNSVGSLACVISAADQSRPLVRGLVLLNCAGGMNNKAIVDDWRIKLVFPLLWLIDFLLQQKPIASALFERVKQRYSFLAADLLNSGWRM